MKKKTKPLTILVCLVVSAFAIRPSIVSAYTQPLETDSGITYPISLTTGKDAAELVVFEDEYFLDYVSTATYDIGSYSGCLLDIDEDGFLSEEECETVRILSPADINEIKSLKGIEAFPKLRELYASNTSISTLDLSNNPRLQIVNCQDTLLTSLDVSECPLLKELKISSCQLTCLDLSSATALEFLTCEYQQRDAIEYKEDDLYKVCLTDLDSGMDLSKISYVCIDGVEGDGINSGYDPDTGIAYCSDEIEELSYLYTFDFGGVSSDSVDKTLSVTLILTTGERQVYKTTDSGSATNTTGDDISSREDTTKYPLQYEAVLTDSQKASLEYMQESDEDLKFDWDQDDIPDQLSTPRLPWYQFTGWYTAKTGGFKITDETTYADIYNSQFSTVKDGQIPTLYARFALTEFTIYYDENGGTSVSDRYGLIWGSANLLPTAKTKKKGYTFAGWKWDGKKVTKKTKLNNSDYAYTNSITLKAIWYKKYEKKGTIFKRYGCVYKVIKSNKKGNRVKLIKIRRKKVTIRNKVFYNGKFFKLKSIRKKSLKKASKIRLKVPKKQRKKYTRMIRKAGAKKSSYKVRKRGQSK